MFRETKKSRKATAADAARDVSEKEKLTEGPPSLSEHCVSASSSVSAAAAAKPHCPASVGFEFEVGDMGVEWNHPTEPLPSKLVILTGEEGTRAETDDGHVEFITAPIISTKVLDPRAAFHTQMGAFQNLIERMKRGVRCQVPDQLLLAYQPYTNNYTLNVDPQETASATIQATIGIPLERLPDLCARYDQEGSRMVKEIDKYYPEANPAHWGKARGLLFACHMYRNFLQGCRLTNKDGPKEACPLMARTDFHSMYRLIVDPEEQVFLQNALREVIIGELGNELLMPRGFRYENTPIGREFSPTYGEWLLSIIEPATASNQYRERMLREAIAPDQHATFAAPDSPLRTRTVKDLMSPPPFYQPHEGSTGFTYGMGKYEVVDELVLFELRGLTPTIKPNFARFTPIAEQLMEFAFFGCE